VPAFPSPTGGATTGPVVSQLACKGMSEAVSPITLVCSVCEGLLPEIAVRAGDPFCSRACADFQRGVGTELERRRAMRNRWQEQVEHGTDRLSLELRRVEVDDRQRLIAEGRFVEEWLEAFAAHRIAHQDGVERPTSTWFSARGPKRT
jgi:hypothetical protein